MHGHAERCASFAKSASRKPPPLDRSVRPPAFGGVVFRPSWDQAGVTLIEKGSSMHRRTFLLAFFGSLAAAPTIIASSSSAEAASMPKARSPVSQPNSEPVSSSGDADADLKKVQADWTQYGYHRRGYRRAYRRGYRRAYRRAYYPGSYSPGPYYPRAYYPRAYYGGPYRRHARRVYRRAYRRGFY
jgi:hypothetical protein